MNVEDLIREEEGSVVKVYKDTRGFLTVGVGHKVIPADDLIEGDEVSQAEIDELFAHDLATARAALVMNLRGYEALDEVRQAVLISMTFNLGWKGLSGFHTTLSLISLKQYAAAAKAMLESLWAKQVPNRAKQLADMMSTGLWPKE